MKLSTIGFIISALICLGVGFLLGWELKGQEYIETTVTETVVDTMWVQTDPIVVRVPVPEPIFIPSGPPNPSGGATQPPVIVTRDSIVYRDSVIYRDPEFEEQVRQYNKAYQDSTLNIDLTATVFGHLLDWDFEYSVTYPEITETTTTTTVFERKNYFDVGINSNTFIIGSEVESFLGVGPRVHLSGWEIGYYPTLQIYPIQDRAVQDQLIHNISVNKTILF